MVQIDLRGKTAFVAGIGDDRGFGWAIARWLKAAGAKVIAGTWPPVYGIFTKGLESGKFDPARELPGGGRLEFDAIFPLDAAFDGPGDVPAEIAENKRYKEHSAYTISEVAELVKARYGQVDILIHSLANGPEVKNPLLATSRKGYLEAISASSYSFVSLLQHFGPLMPPGSAATTLTFMAAVRSIPGYGGGMSSAKAALESDTRTLAFEAGRKWGVRVNAVSAGPYGSRAAKAIGLIDRMIDYSIENAPLQKELLGDDIGKSVLFLSSPLASAVTGATLYVDNGLHTMGMAAPHSLKEN